MRMTTPLPSLIAVPVTLSTATPVIWSSPARQSLRRLTVKTPMRFGTDTLLQPAGVTGVAQSAAPVSRVFQEFVSTSLSNAHSMPASAAY